MTAVEWLLEELIKGDFEQQQIAIKKAKEMEKQQGYSEEEVLDILFTMSVVNPSNITKWFEQFKKK